MKGELPMFQAVQQIMGEVMSFPQLEEESDEPLAAELKAARNAKKVALLVAGVAAQKFRDRLKDEQEVLALGSNIIMEAYAMESAVPASAEGDELRTMLAALRRFTKHEPANTVALRRAIAARVIETERYPLS
jgi:hypothetical protein